MSIKKYFSNADNTITNAAGITTSIRGTGSNMGASDILEVFSIYGQQTTSSAELSRAMLKFPVGTISSDRSSGAIPLSGGVNFILKMSNAEHTNTVPANSQVSILAISSSWNEGTGMDMEDYSDSGESNWISNTSASTWVTPGGDYHASPSYVKSLDTGLEDLEIDITSFVEEWMAGTKDKHG